MKKQWFFLQKSLKFKSDLDLDFLFNQTDGLNKTNNKNRDKILKGEF